MNYKEEVIKRYCYLYENALFILLPCIKEKKEEIIKKNKSKCKKNNIDKVNSIYFNGLSEEFLLYIEEILFSDIKLEETSGYNFFENLKQNREYLEKVKTGKDFLNYRNNIIVSPNEVVNNIFKMNLDIQTIFNQEYIFLNRRIDDSNCTFKLKALDEYFRISRYKNDGKIWTSGAKINAHDFVQLENGLLSPNQIEDEYKKDITNNGITFNDFLFEISENIHLTEKEKQQIYLNYHDELPCDLTIICQKDKILLEYIPEINRITSKTDRKKPFYSKPCSSISILNEKDIFISKDTTVDKVNYRFHVLCPECGYIINVDETLLSEGIKKRIIEKCEKDRYLYRKMYLTSELKSLEIKSSLELSRKKTK